jgi:hypothetical protein
MTTKKVNRSHCILEENSRASATNVVRSVTRVSIAEVPERITTAKIQIITTMKKGTTRDFFRLIYGPNPCQANLHIYQKSKSKRPFSRKDRRHLQRFDISKAFLNPPSNEPSLSIPTKKEKGVQSTFGKDGKMGDWFIGDFGEWFHTDKAKAHCEQLKRISEIKLT